MIRGNKGEWSEFYAFVKLLADGKIYAADRNLNKNESIYYLILKIIRGSTEHLNYIINSRISIEKEDGTVVSTIPISSLIEFSERLYIGISRSMTSEDSFQTDVIDFFEMLHTNRLCDESVETADIRIVIHDPITQYEPLLGFSIKSYIGSKPTLFNSSQQSNFIYKISPDLTDELTDYLNQMDTYSSRINWLVTNGYELRFLRLYSEVFKSNLELIDSRLPEIIASALLHNYTTGENRIQNLIQYLNLENPCQYNIALNPNFYEYKIKRLLVDMALGMKAGRLWTGTFNANGGYIAVKRSGEILCFHIYNWNDFQEYLVRNTKIDHPDSNVKRCNYGRILTGSVHDFIEGSYVMLNMQIRFI